MTDHLTPDKRSWNMSRISSKNTKPELLVRRYLYSNGFRYRLHCKTLPGKPDLLNKSKKITVFVNGCFWHQHPNCKRANLPKSNRKYWIPKLERNIKRQEDNLNLLISWGWYVHTIWECEVQNPIKLKKLLSLIKNSGGIVSK